MSAPINVRRDKAVEVFVYTVTLALLVVVIIGSHLVVWDDMNQREVLRMRRAHKGTMPISYEGESNLNRLLPYNQKHAPQGSEGTPPQGYSDPYTQARQAGETAPYESMALSAAALCGLEDQGLAVFFAIISRESTWRMYDKQGHVLRSRSGALGLTQIKPATAREMGTSDPHTPWGNLLLGACYLRKQYDRFGTWERAVLAYRVGPKGVATAEARRYVDDVMEGAE